MISIEQRRELEDLVVTSRLAIFKVLSDTHDNPMVALKVPEYQNIFLALELLGYLKRGKVTEEGKIRLYQ